MPDVNEGTLVEQGAIPPTEFHDKIERIREISDYDIDSPPDLSARLERPREAYSSHLKPFGQRQRHCA